MEELKSKKVKKSEVEKQCKYFSFYKKMPAILVCVIMALFFIWGIVDACVIVTYNSYHYAFHGIMMLHSSFLCWLIWIAIGAVLSVCAYFASKLTYSHRLLQIHYLQKISGEEESNLILK